TVFTPANTRTTATTTSASTKIRAPDIAISPQGFPRSLAHPSTLRLVQPRVGRQPAVEEALDPAIQWRIVQGRHGQEHPAPLAAGKLQSLRRFQSPDMLHLERDLGMELEAEGVRPVAERLHRKRVVGGEKLAAARQLHAFSMPLVDLH